VQFPTDYPLKVLGRPQEGFRARVHAIVLRHAPLLEPERVSERLSAKGNFMSMSYLLRAESRAQVEALVSELQACEGVLMLI
jgi:putative lipoic acid-binding regulatory protein